MTNANGEFAQIERAAIRILVRDQEKITQIMEQVFGCQKKKVFINWSKSEGNFDDL